MQRRASVRSDRFKRLPRAEAEKAVNDMLEKVKERVGEYIYSCDDEELVQVVCRKLMDQD